MMRLSPGGLALIKRWESCRLTAYLDSGGLPTIGWGTTRYPDGRRVRIGDVCTQNEADAWLAGEVAHTELQVDDLTVDTISVNQFDALVSFAYNVGVGAFRGSTLRKLVNQDPLDPEIDREFKKWCHDNGKFVQGLLNRRTAEADLYFGRSL